MTYVIAGLIVILAMAGRMWFFLHISQFRTNVDRSDPDWFLWSNPVKVYDRQSYTSQGRALLPWFVACEVGVVLAIGVALWLLARAGLL